MTPTRRPGPGDPQMPLLPGTITARDIALAIGRPEPTPEQVAVIEAPAAPLLVVAGAGSGKTETMAARVVWLVANQLTTPDQVLGLTFTRKAAGELAERVRRRLRRLAAKGLVPDLGESDGDADISTYHAFAGRLVREHALRLGVEPESRLLTEAAAWQYAREVVERWDGDMSEVGNSPSTIVDALLKLSGECAEHLIAPRELLGYLDELEDRITDLPSATARGTIPAEVKSSSPPSRCAAGSSRCWRSTPSASVRARPSTSVTSWRWRRSWPATSRTSAGPSGRARRRCCWTSSRTPATPSW